MGQPSNYIANRVGTFMYWESSWVNVQNFQNFQVKVFFIQKLLYYFFSDKIFNLFFIKTSSKMLHVQLTKFYLKTKNVYVNTKSIASLTHINLSKLWIIKYRNFLIFQIFGFFFKKKKFTPGKFLRKKLNFLLLFNQRRFKKSKQLKQF